MRSDRRRQAAAGVGDDVEWVVLCSEGYPSSLAAASLLDPGLHRATDVVGGYWAMRKQGVLTESPSIIGGGLMPGFSVRPRPTRTAARRR